LTPHRSADLQSAGHPSLSAVQQRAWWRWVANPRNSRLPACAARVGPPGSFVVELNPNAEVERGGTGYQPDGMTSRQPLTSEASISAGVIVVPSGW